MKASFRRRSSNTDLSTRQNSQFFRFTTTRRGKDKSQIITGSVSPGDDSIRLIGAQPKIRIITGPSDPHTRAHPIATPGPNCTSIHIDMSRTNSTHRARVLVCSHELGTVESIDTVCV